MLEQFNEILQASSAGVSFNLQYLVSAVLAFVASFFLVKLFYKLLQLMLKVAAVSVIAFLMLEYGPEAIEILQNKELQAKTGDKIIESTNGLRQQLLASVGDQLFEDQFMQDQLLEQ